MVQVEVVLPKRVDIDIMSTPSLSVEVLSEIIHMCEHEKFKGDYELTPTFEGRTLATQNMVMKFDVQLKPIPVERVANQSGGNTIIIGG